METTTCATCGQSVRIADAIRTVVRTPAMSGPAFYYEHPDCVPHCAIGHFANPVMCNDYPTGCQKCYEGEA
ncbi:MAG: hypothetical protein WCP21_11280 [Armatimonadota bacterium]